MRAEVKDAATDQVKEKSPLQCNEDLFATVQTCLRECDHFKLI